MRDLIIIGGGPAGCTAGIYAARKKLDTLLISKDFTGQVGLSTWVENYPGFRGITGLDLAKNFHNHLKSFDIDINFFEKVIEIKKGKNFFHIKTDEGEHKSRAVIITTGATPKRLEVENEEKFIGNGISYCVTCDETSFEDKRVVVVGGGNAGAEAALELTRFAKNVYLFEILEGLTADGILIDQLKKNSKVEIMTSVSIKSFEGKEDLEKIIYLDKRDNKEKELCVDGCFVEIGGIPNTDFLEGVVELNKKGEIVVDPKTFETSVEGIYAAGDVVDFKDKQVVIATGQGAIAALCAFRYINDLGN